MAKTPTKILLIRFSSIGDIVLTTPIIRCLKKQLKADVHYLTKQSFSCLLAHNPYIDKVFTLNKKVSEVLPDLKKEGYDYVIDLHKNLRSSQVKFALKAKSYSFNKINFEKWLIVNFKINRLPNIHIVDRYFETVKELGIENDEEGLDYFLPNDFKSQYQELFNIQGYIVFAIGAAHLTKRLPKEKIISICQKIKQPTFLIGGKDVEKEGVEIAKKCGDNIQNLCGKLSLHDSAALIRDASKVITHDTGMMHISAAFQKEIISIWGNTIPGLGMYPYYEKGVERNTTIEIKNLSCRPCSKIGYPKCPKGHFKCMMDISEEEIIQKI
ncbi:glycosyltransferase family 9 protein [Saprospiraceae bacterium]|jgi:ADP-heptose:LPS heptosyltransferase|nr:glycosyltransferase family 9 protein [Bacteroidota bacterium]MDB4727154.1 glycosyltransferase family 9 protein [Saprospiraceae bacterium]MDF1863390.1 glycosyltransferase family 9 protein [Saprospiraceae bacterium]